VLPPFYAPTYAQVARDVNSLGVGITFGIITALGLSALFESLQILEDPFTAFLALDGIDVREEFEVLHYAQLVSTRKLAFPDAPPYPVGRRGALTVYSKRPQVGKMPSVALLSPQSHDRTATDIEPSDLGLIDVDVLIPTEEPQDMELGMPMEEADGGMLRETVFNASDDAEASRARLASAASAGTLRSRRHVRDWSRG
jgi:hypothetical protein